MNNLANFIYEKLKTFDEINDMKKLIIEEYGYVENEEIDGVLRSLLIKEILNFEEIKNMKTILTNEGNYLKKNGSYEWRIIEFLKKNGNMTKSSIDDKLDEEVVKYGFPTAIKNGWIYIDKGIVCLVDKTIRDEVKNLLIKVEEGDKGLNEKEINMLKRRKLIELKNITLYKVKKGPKYNEGLLEKQTELTQKHLRNDEWKNLKYKGYNLSSKGKIQMKGNLHPLMKVKEEFKNIFIEMGFKEMETSRFVESSFWNFDALFQPQKHSARDAHDTFFMKEPNTTKYIPMDYMKKVCKVHSVGDYGSIGYQSEWLESEARKNVLRTHTTAISAKLLYNLSKSGNIKAGKYFSIDRVFRNEAIDATHLAEFHQIEGVMLDYGLGIQHLMGVIDVFFKKMGLTKLKYKPTYNPYTEPSLEIFCYHEGLKKWIEIGNSGLFRPEMLRTMGLPEDIAVAGWGLSLERPTMIRYGISNIRDVMGHKMSLDLVKNNAMCTLGYD